MNQNSFSSKAWLNLGVFTTLLLGSVWWMQTPLISSRPRDSQTSRLIDASFPTEKPFARQWQDPFEPYFDYTKLQENKSKPSKKKTAKQKQDEERDKLKTIFNRDFEKRFTPKSEKQEGEDLLLMGIMVPGGPFEDRTERRQRIRVALASAMAAGGYAPVDNEYLGSFPVCLDSNQIKVPYEWFTKLSKDERRYRSFPSKYKRILVFWISDDYFAEKPLLFLHKLRKDVQSSLEEIGEKPQIEVFKKAEFAIFGPWSSTTLKKLLEEAELLKKAHCGQMILDLFRNLRYVLTFSISSGEMGKLSEGCGTSLFPEYDRIEYSRFVFYNVFSTAPPNVLLEILEPQTSHSSQQDKNKEKNAEEVFEEAKRRIQVKLSGALKKVTPNHVFHYTTCPDSLLAEAMKGELEQRGVNLEKDQIAFIAEHDTLYGRSLPKTFRREFIGEGTEANNIERFTYLRGLDGRLPQESSKSDSEATNSGSQGGNPRMSIESRFVPTRKTNRPEGNNQFDYIIRLGEEMKQMEQQKGRRFKVIGILGSDIYDKLLLLQALRPLFPNALFFTTDLDAAYSHPQELEWTKNLLVASTHGLALDEYYQCGVLPFRFSYQTAVFQAILAATTKSKCQAPSKECKCHPKYQCVSKHEALLDFSPARIFEIGWDKAYDLSHPRDTIIHPQQHQINWRFYLWYACIFTWILFLILIALFALTWHRKVFRFVGSIIKWFVSPCSFWKPIEKYLVELLDQKNKQQISDHQADDSSQPSDPKWRWRIIAVSLFIIYISFNIWDCRSPDGELWLLGSGISAWPSTTLRLLAGIISVSLFVAALKRLKKTRGELCKDFKLPPIESLFLKKNFSWNRVTSIILSNCGSIKEMGVSLAFPKEDDDENENHNNERERLPLWGSVRVHCFYGKSLFFNVLPSVCLIKAA